MLTRCLALALIALLAGCTRPPAAAQAPPGVSGLRVPPGFRVTLFASGLGRARFLAFDPQGRLMVCDLGGGRVLTLPDANRDGRADRTLVFASGLSLPHSLAWHQGRAYVAGGGQVVVLTDANRDGVAESRRVIVSDLPTGGVHVTRTIVFSPDGRYFYVSVGSSTNVSPERDRRRAAVLRFAADGTHQQIFATGLRNSVGLAFHPDTGVLWGTDNGRDWLGDDLPPDEINLLRQGGFYGWPYYYGDNVPDPAFSRRPPPGLPPALKLQAHSAPLGLCFYTGRQFPAEYRGDAFVCFHGSWNRRQPTGYKIVRVRVRQGRPVSYEDFLTGFLSGREASGRPVDVRMGPDGALYFSDDQGGRIFRITWAG